MTTALTAPFATPATGSLGNSVPVNQTASTGDSARAPALTSAYNRPAGWRQYVDMVQRYATKHAWVILGVLVVAALLFMQSGRRTLCSNFGVACDTRPLPGGVRGV